MPSLTGLRDAAVATLAARLPRDTPVRAFSGTLSADTVRSVSIKARTVFVAALKAQNVAPGDSLAFDLSAVLGVLVVARHGKDANREKDGLAVTEAVAKVLHGNTFDLSGVSPARVEIMESLADDELAADGICVWSVVWQQAFTFDLHEATP